MRSAPLGVIPANPSSRVFVASSRTRTPTSGSSTTTRTENGRTRTSGRTTIEDGEDAGGASGRAGGGDTLDANAVGADDEDDHDPVEAGATPWPCGRG